MDKMKSKSKSEHLLAKEGMLQVFGIGVIMVLR